MGFARRSRVTVLGSAAARGLAVAAAAMEGWDDFPTFGTRPSMGQTDFSGATDVLVENKTFTNTPASKCALRFLAGCTNVMVRECDFIDCPGGVFATDSTGITLKDCRYRNITGPHERVGNNVANLIQTVRCSNILVSHNKGKEGDTEDVVSIFESTGAIVEDNWFEGLGWLTSSGAGIGLCDLGGDNNIARRNIIINIGAAGIFIAGGTNSAILNNIIYEQQMPRSNVGIYVWRVTGDEPCSGHEVSGNRVRWLNEDGIAAGWFNGGNCGEITNLNNNDFNDLTLDIEDYRVTGVTP